MIIEDVLFVCWESMLESGDGWHPVLETLVLDENVVEVLIEGPVVTHLDALKHSLRELLPGCRVVKYPDQEQVWRY